MSRLKNKVTVIQVVIVALGLVLPKNLKMKVQ